MNKGESMYNYEDLYNIAMKQISSHEIEPLPITYAYSDTSKVHQVV